MEPVTNSFLDFNMFGWPWTGLVTLFALAVYYVLTYRVGMARKMHGVKAPETSGPVPFQIALRIQMNTLEQIVVFLPLLWMAALATRDEFAALIGVFWPISRILYAKGYLTGEPVKRGPGFMLGFAVVVILFLVILVQLLRSLVFWQEPSAMPLN